VVRLLAWIAALLVAGAALGEIAVAAAGSEHDPAAAVFGLATIAGGALCLTLRAGRAPAVLAPAAGVFAVAADYTMDPYYLPTKQRYHVNGPVPVWWMALLLVAGVAMSVLALLRPRVAGPLTGVFVLVVLVSVLFAGDGH
jgi:hypothetical protein